MAKLYIKNTDGTFAPHSSIAVTKLDVVQDKGNSLTSAMSQKAVTDELTTKQNVLTDTDGGYGQRVAKLEKEGIASQEKLTELDIRVFGLDAKLGFRFDSDKIIKGSYYNSSTGEVQEAPTYDRTPLIEVEGDYLFYGGLNKSISIASFDKNKTFISYAGTDPARDNGVFALPDGTRYVGINFRLKLYPDGYSNGYIYTQSELRKTITDALSLIDQKLSNTPSISLKEYASSNLFDLNSISINKLLSSSGELVDNEHYYTSDFIEVNPNTTYVVIGKTGSPKIRVFAFFNKDKEYISLDASSSVSTFTTGDRTKYVRVSIDKNYPASDIAISIDGTTEFEEYGHYVQYTGLSIGDNVIMTKKQIIDYISQIPLFAGLSMQIIDSPNLMNPSDVEMGKFLSSFNVVDLASYNTTGYIPVEPNKTYKLFGRDGNFGARSWAEFDANKGNLTSHNDSALPNTLTMGANTYFIRLSYLSSLTDATKLGVFESPASQFVPYGKMTDVKVNGSPLGYEEKANTSLVTKTDLEQRLSRGVAEKPVVIVKTGKNLEITSGDFIINASLDSSVDSYYGYNHEFNFTRYTHIPSSQYINLGDDVAPAHVINSTIGANHGQPCAIATITGHGLTNTAIGTAWTHTNGIIFYVTRIVDEDRIQFLSANQGTLVSPRFTKITTGSISRDGVTKVISSVSSSQLYPSSQNVVQHIYLNGETEVIDDGTYECDFFDVVETYDVADPVSVLENLIARAGSSDAPTMEGDSLIKFKNIYRFLPNNNVLVFATYVPQREMAFSDFMFTQSSLGESFKYYLPNSNPIGGIDFRSPVKVTWSSSVPQLLVKNSEMADPNNPVNRVVTYGDNFGFSLGFLPVSGVGKNLRNFTDNTFEIRSNTGKIYPHGVDQHVGTTLQTNQVYSAVMYRALINNSSKTGNRMSMYHMDVNGEEFIFLDYSGSMTDYVLLDKSFNGRSIEVVESVNTTLLSDVYNDGFYVKADYTNGKTCFMVAKILKK